MKARDVFAAAVGHSKVLLVAAAVVALALTLGVTLAAAVAPVVTIEDATEVEYTTAKVKGEVNPEGQATTWRLQYATQADFSDAVTVEEEGTESPKTVERKITGLTPGTTYYARLQAENGDGTVEDVTNPFQTKAPVPAPTITNLEVTSVTGDSAHFSAEIDPGSTSSDPAVETSWSFSCEPSCGNFSGPAVSGGPEVVEGDATGLEANTDFTVKLTAHNQGGGDEESTSFSTAGAAPSVLAFAAGPIQSDQAELNGEVNSHNSPTTYWFEWGTEDCSAGGCTKTPAAPAGVNEVQQVLIEATGGDFTLTFEGDTTPDLPHDTSPQGVQEALEGLPTVGSGNVSVQGTLLSKASHYWVEFVGDLARTDVPTLAGANGSSPLTVEEGANPGTIEVRENTQGGFQGYAFFSYHLTGLEPQTTYHFRLVAENANGTAAGNDQEFTTAAPPASSCPNEARRSEQSSTYLPDCRAYEMASPADKNGGDVFQLTRRTRAAVDGSAVNFASLVGFGDVQGGTIATEYIAERTATPGTSGWSTHGISPAQHPLPQAGALFGLDPSYEGEMSADLSAGVFRAYRPITDAPDVAGLLNLYVRRDLRVPGPGTYQPITDPGFPVPVPSFPVRPFFAGASADFSHIIFESRLSLDKETSGFEPKLYEWSNGALRLAGRVPPPGETECDDDGSTPCETALGAQAGQGAANFEPTSHMISADGSRIFFQDTSTGNIYMRVNGTTTVQLNASEKSTKEAPQGATLWDASVDGTRIFFSTSEGLVNGDDDASDDYYMYDVNAPAEHHLTLISHDSDESTVDSGQGFIGASADGHYAYFMMFGQLLARASSNNGLYVWHDGGLRGIGSIPGQDHNENQRRYNWNFSEMIARVSADGSHLMFVATSDAGLKGHGGFAGFDHGTACGGGSGCGEVYVYDAQTGRLRCASCAPSGAPPTAEVRVNVSAGANGNASGTSYLSHALSSDGRYVFFSSPDPLVAADTNGKYDAYEYDTETEQVHLLSSGTANSDSYFMDASADGHDAFFVTSQPLLGWDPDGSYDLYDARVGGGFPEPAPEPAPCEGDSCRSAASAAPNAAIVGSNRLAAGNPPKRCPKGRRRTRVRGKVRCVKRHHKHSRHASSNRRTNR